MLIPLSKSHDRICVGLFLDYVALNCVSVIQVLYCLNYFRIIISLRNHQLEDICFCKSYKSLFLSQGSLDYSRSSVSIEILDLACLFLKKKKPIRILIEIGLTSHVNLRSIDILTILSPLIYEHISAFI